MLKTASMHILSDYKFFIHEQPLNTRFGANLIGLMDLNFDKPK